MPVPDIYDYVDLWAWLSRAMPGQRHRLTVSLSMLAGWVGVTPGHLNNIRERVRGLPAEYLMLLGAGLGLDPPRQDRLVLLWRLATATTDEERQEIRGLLDAGRPARRRGRPARNPPPSPPATPLGGCCAAIDLSGPPLDAWLEPAQRALASHPDPRVSVVPGLLWPAVLPQQRPPRQGEPAAQVGLDAADPEARLALRQGLGVARLALYRLETSDTRAQFSQGALPAAAVPRCQEALRQGLRRALEGLPPLTADQPARLVTVGVQLLALTPALTPDEMPPDHAALWAALGAPEPEAPAATRNTKAEGGANRKGRHADPGPDIFAAPDVRTYLKAFRDHRVATLGGPNYARLARLAGLTASHMGRVFRDARDLTPEQVPAFSRGLRHSPEQAEHFSLLLARERNADPAGRDALTRKMLLNPRFRAAWPELAAYYEGMASATHHAVYLCSGLRAFRADPPWLATALGVAPELARQALHDLIRHGFLVYGPDHRLRPAKPVVVSAPVSHHPTGVRTADQMLMAAQLAVGTDATLLHQQVHLWVPLSHYEAFLQAVVDIQRAVDAIAAEYGIDPQADQVLAWLVQCVPLTSPWPPEPEDAWTG